MRFVYAAAPTRIVMGEGALAELPAELARLGAQRVLVVASPGQAAAADALAAMLGATCAGVHARAIVHVPAEVAAAGRAHAEACAADTYVAYGGGAAIGLAKAIALATGHPILAVPTTFAGSEVTSIWGLTEAGVKRTGRDPRVLPRTVIYDPRLFAGLPTGVAGSSGINAIAHAAEALYAVDGNPAIAALAEAAVRSLARALPALPAPAALTEAVTGAWLAGTCLGAVGMALHHKLCHVLGGAFDLPHAEMHAIILPHALAYNAPAAQAAMAALGRALDVPAAAVPGALFELRARVGGPAALAHLGMPGDGITRALDLALAAPYPNPRPLERAALHALLTAAHAGARP